MDVLSILLEDVHLHHTQYYRLKLGGQWAYSISKEDVIWFYMIESGSANLMIDGVCQRLEAGQIAMLPNTQQHTCHRPGHHHPKPQCLNARLRADTEEVWAINAQAPVDTQIVLFECRYDKEVTKPLLAALPAMLGVEMQSESYQQSSIPLILQYLARQTSQEDLGKTAINNHLASLLLIECFSSFIKGHAEATPGWLLAIKDPYLAKALAVMHDRPENNWTIHQLAEVAGMSRTSFAERFKEIVGVTPLSYLTDYRLRLAARYLRLQPHSISRISELVGYASDSTFSQAFKRVYGLSPGAYRQQNQNKPQSS